MNLESANLKLVACQHALAIYRPFALSPSRPIALSPSRPLAPLLRVVKVRQPFFAKQRTRGVWVGWGNR